MVHHGKRVSRHGLSSNGFIYPAVEHGIGLLGNLLFQLSLMEDWICIKESIICVLSEILLLYTLQSTNQIKFGMEYPALLSLCEVLLGKFERPQMSKTTRTEQLICEQGGGGLKYDCCDRYLSHTASVI